MNRTAHRLRCRAGRLRATPQHRIPSARAFFSSEATGNGPPDGSSSSSLSKRPSSAPKPILDIKKIRQNPELYEKTCIDRNYARQAGHAKRIVDLHAEWQDLTRSGRAIRERSNLLRRQLSNPMTSSDDDVQDEVRRMTREEIQAEARRLKQELSGMTDQESRVLAAMEELALDMPNLTSEETPPGDEAVLLSYINQVPAPAAAEADGEGATKTKTKPLSHVQIGMDLGILDFAAAATASGWGWYYLVGEAAQLEQALIQYALAAVTRHGWTQVSPPSMVYSHIGSACGFQPRDQSGEQQVYTVAQTRHDAERGAPEMCLTGTSEISLAGMKAASTLRADDLPMRRVAVSRCYRAEAGARGADTKGLYRVHEFSKVEMFAWTPPDQDAADDVFDEILDIQTEILSSLGLPARILEMPAHDLGASATRKVDMEAWFPGRAVRRGSSPESQQEDGWGEVSSASLCTDYQTRRLNTRMRLPGDKLTFPWTANGTALAAPRIIAALLENGYDDDTKTVRIPECLRPWMDGKDKIGLGRQPIIPAHLLEGAGPTEISASPGPDERLTPDHLQSPDDQPVRAGLGLLVPVLAIVGLDLALLEHGIDRHLDPHRQRPHLIEVDDDDGAHAPQQAGQPEDPEPAPPGAVLPAYGHHARHHRDGEQHATQVRQAVQAASVGGAATLVPLLVSAFLPPAGLLPGRRVRGPPQDQMTMHTLHQGGPHVHAAAAAAAAASGANRDESWLRSRDDRTARSVGSCGGALRSLPRNPIHRLYAISPGALPSSSSPSMSVPPPPSSSSPLSSSPWPTSRISGVPVQSDMRRNRAPPRLVATGYSHATPGPPPVLTHGAFRACASRKAASTPPSRTRASATRCRSGHSSTTMRLPSPAGRGSLAMRPSPLLEASSRRRRSCVSTSPLLLVLVLPLFPVCPSPSRSMQYPGDESRSAASSSVSETRYHVL
ncbi:LOW QUALITY PROTEIN: seryl-tRNA synthetase [Geosmithia morbida]|uniref:serine--tRNA ligase n=1 Tax=Geosmithia morbida TaxID=1094350 RepID=A0A9P4YVB7_9HYPO|nr:LOW QUALITY PROTEIN: seryl-tRNA synthetase [Geosmithia morbida]KAF4121664.1 LOW QUALITY PROTEIN: seryl-tRNA synthetase [Geosmithia morbida]